MNNTLWILIVVTMQAMILSPIVLPRELNFIIIFPLNEVKNIFTQEDEVKNGINFKIIKFRKKYIFVID